MQVLHRSHLATPLLLVTTGLFIPSPPPLTADPARATSGPVDQPGWLGVSIQEISEGIRQALGLHSEGGVLVNDVLEASPAQQAGLRAGDVITKFNGREVEGTSDFIEMVRESRPGEEATLTLLRDGESMTVDVEISRPLVAPKGVRDHGSRRPEGRDPVQDRG